MIAEVSPSGEQQGSILEGHFQWKFFDTIINKPQGFHPTAYNRILIYPSRTEKIHESIEILGRLRREFIDAASVLTFLSYDTVGL